MTPHINRFLPVLYATMKRKIYTFFKQIWGLVTWHSGVFLRVKSVHVDPVATAHPRTHAQTHAQTRGALRLRMYQRTRSIWIHVYADIHLLL